MSPAVKVWNGSHDQECFLILLVVVKVVGKLAFSDIVSVASLAVCETFLLRKSLTPTICKVKIKYKKMVKYVILRYAWNLQKCHAYYARIDSSFKLYYIICRGSLSNGMRRRAVFVPQLFDQPSGALRAGLTSFSACLVGTVTVELVPALYHQPVSGTLFFWIILMSALR